MNNLPSNSKNSSVLVVDDEPGMRTALQANFLRHGWSVETASGVRDAARAMERANFDLVVTDIRMRDGDGFEVMSSVQKKSPKTSVILLTAFGSVPEAVQSMRGGAFDYLTKPVSFDQLQATATRVLQRMADTTTPVESRSQTERTDPPAPGSLADIHCSCNPSIVDGLPPAPTQMY